MLKVSKNITKFQPRVSCKLVSYNKKCMYFKVAQSILFLFHVSKLHLINIASEMTFTRALQNRQIRAIEINFMATEIT